MEMGFRSAWGSVRSGRARKPHTSLTTPALALKKYIYMGRVKQRDGVWSLEREEHGRVIRGMLETELGLQEREKGREIERRARIKGVWS